jgi:hypothetical protein
MLHAYGTMLVRREAACRPLSSPVAALDAGCRCARFIPDVRELVGFYYSNCGRSI